MVNQKIYQEQKIIEIIKNNPDTILVFYKEKIDLSKCSQLTLQRVCTKYNKNILLILSKLNEDKKFKNNLSFIKDNLDTCKVIDVVLKYFHEPLKKEMEEIKTLIINAEKENKIKINLSSLRNYILILFEDLTKHMLKEELNLFPLVKSYINGEFGDDYFGDLRRPVWEMEMEHENSSDLMRKIRKITNDYNVSESSPEIQKELYRSLDKLEFDLYVHIFLENVFIHPVVLSFK